MKLMLWLLALSGYTITVQCHLQTIVANPGGIGGIYKGPDSQTIVKGPDGSVITSQEKGGLIATEQKLGPIIAAEPDILEVSQPVLPVLYPNGPAESVLSSENVISPVGPSYIEDGYLGPLGDPVISPPGPSVVTPLKSIVQGTIAPPVYTGPPVALDLPLQGTLAPPVYSDSPVALEPALVPPAPSVVLEPGLPGTLAPPVHSVAPNAVGHRVDIIEPDPHIIETEIIDAPAIESNESSDLVGPSGSISTRGSESIVSGPASTTITKKAKIIVAQPVLAAAPLLATVPVVTPVAAPVLPVSAVPLVEVNNEIPLASPSPVVLPSVGPILSSTVSPLSVSTPAPPVFSPIVSTLAPPLPKPEGNLPPSVGPNTPPPLPPHYVPVQTVRVPFATGLLSGEEFVDVQPNFVSTIAPPRVLVPTAAPHYPTSIASTTVRPLPAQPLGPVQVSTSQPDISVEDEGASGFVQPGLQSYGPSTASPISSTVAPPSYGEDFYNNKQLFINPANIPLRNIVPPEVGVPRGAIDLGSTVTSVTQPHNEISSGPGVVQSTNLQGIDTDVIQRLENFQGIENDNLQPVDNQPPVHNIQNGYYRNNILVGNVPNNNYYYPQPNANEALLSNTNPIQRFPQDEVPEAAPLIAQADASLPPDSDEKIEASLWNRYGRKRRNRKY